MFVDRAPAAPHMSGAFATLAPRRETCVVDPDLRLIRQPGRHHHVLGPYAEPIASVRPGETVVVHTVDCVGGHLTREDRVPVGEADSASNVDRLDALAATPDPRLVA